MLLTIGHSNHTLPYFLGMIAAHDVAVLVDVRSRPHSKHNPQFNREEFAKALAEEGVRYIWGGRYLGGLGGVSVKSIPFVQAMGNVVLLQEHQTVAVMCAERNPADCHRTSKLLPWIHTHFTRDKVNTAHIIPGEVLDGREFQSQSLPNTDQLTLGL